jgi:uncharacterized protein
MKKEDILKQTEKYIKKILSDEGSGHDWWHVYRVWKNAIHIGKDENADLFVVQLAALLHDISDWKFNDGNDNVGPQLAREWLEKKQVEEKIISHVCEIIKTMSFKGAGVKISMHTIEGMIVQDADRLDAIGAVGIARGFVFAGNKNLPMHDPSIEPIEIKDFKTYSNIRRPTYTQINHFHEKLLLLKDLMNTKTAKKIAEKRHKFMEEFLERFYKEWDGKD